MSKQTLQTTQVGNENVIKLKVNIRNFVKKYELYEFFHPPKNVPNDYPELAANKQLSLVN